MGRLGLKGSVGVEAMEGRTGQARVGSERDVESLG